MSKTTSTPRPMSLSTFTRKVEKIANSINQAYCVARIQQSRVTKSATHYMYEIRYSCYVHALDWAMNDNPEDALTELQEMAAKYNAGIAVNPDIPPPARAL